MKNNSVFIFISPHLDDVILSCSGYIHQLVCHGDKVVIATVVTADDTSQLPPSWLAQRNLLAWGRREKIFSLRCEEDKAAAAVLGAEVVHLGFMDCIFRRDMNQNPLYTRRVINTPVHPLDWTTFEPMLQNSLKDLFTRYAEYDLHIVCPLAIGEHVDHVIVRHAVEALCDPACMIYYEDFPYARQIDHYRMKLESLFPGIISLTEDAEKLRIKAAAFYVSQIPGLFPSFLDMLLEIARARLLYVGKLIPVWHHIPSAMRRMERSLLMYSSQIGGERYWTRTDSPELFRSTRST